ncbi:hypothetical protein SERLA73DRAFT_190752, partial [Serpula lacrymans var. lacrymans S7.3]
MAMFGISSQKLLILHRCAFLHVIPEFQYWNKSNDFSDAKRDYFKLQRTPVTCDMLTSCVSRTLEISWVPLNIELLKPPNGQLDSEKWLGV